MNLSNTLIQQLNSSNDKLVLINENGEPQAVLMSYAAYESFIKAIIKHKTPSQSNSRPAGRLSKINNGLTSDKLLDKINNEIAQWKENEHNPISLDDGYVFKNNKAKEMEENDEKYGNGEWHADNEDDEALYFETADDDNNIYF